MKHRGNWTQRTAGEHWLTQLELRGLDTQPLRKEVLYNVELIGWDGYLS